MKYKILLATLLLFVGTTCFSQYQYEITIETNSGESAKRIFSKICKRIDLTNRRIDGDRLIFESKNIYTEDKMEQIVQLAGYDLILFKQTKVIVESKIDKK